MRAGFRSDLLLDFRVQNIVVRRVHGLGRRVLGRDLVLLVRVLAAVRLAGVSHVAKVRGRIGCLPLCAET